MFSTLRNRRWFKFSLRTLLVLVALVAFSTWWITWPERTRGEVERSIANGQTDVADRWIEWTPYHKIDHKIVSRDLQQWHSIAPRRSVVDLLLGRQVYYPPTDGLAYWIDTGQKFDHIMLESLTIERGKIKYKWGCTMAEWFAQGH